MSSKGTLCSTSNACLFLCLRHPLAPPPPPSSTAGSHSPSLRSAAPLPSTSRILSSVVVNSTMSNAHPSFLYSSVSPPWQFFPEIYEREQAGVTDTDPYWCV